MSQILVCMKAVPLATDSVGGSDLQLDREKIKLQWSPSDESALEAALRLKGENGSVTVLSMGPQKLMGSLQDLFGRGVDNAVLLTDPAMAGADTHATAKALAAAVRNLGEFDLILCGRRSMDGETGQVPGMLAAALGYSCVTDAECLQETEQGIHASRLMAFGSATVELQLPAVISVCEYSYHLRLPGILGRRKAKNKQVQLLSAMDIGLDPGQCGLRGSLTKVVRAQHGAPGLRKGPKETDITVAAKKILQLCREVWE